MDRRRLWPVGVTAKAADLKVKTSGVRGVAEARRGLSRSFESGHALVPGDTRQAVRLLPSPGRALRRMPYRTAVNALARLRAYQGTPAWRRSASRYRMGFIGLGTQSAGNTRLMPQEPVDLIGQFFRFRDLTVAFLDPTIRGVEGISGPRQLSQRRRAIIFR
jgi:hypothetical protein